MSTELFDACTVTAVLWTLAVGAPERFTLAEPFTPTEVVTVADPRVVPDPLTLTELLPDPDVPTLTAVPVLGPLDTGAAGAGAGGAGIGGAVTGPIP